jgi:cyclic pyranopterin phosphate synthase
MAKHFKSSGVILRFIEFMDVGSSNGWNMEQVLPSKEVIARINKVFPLEPVEANYTEKSHSAGVMSMAQARLV